MVNIVGAARIAGESPAQGQSDAGPGAGMSRFTGTLMERPEEFAGPGFRKCRSMVADRKFQHRRTTFNNQFQTGGRFGLPCIFAGIYPPDSR